MKRKTIGLAMAMVLLLGSTLPASASSSEAIENLCAAIGKVGKITATERDKGTTMSERLRQERESDEESSESPDAAIRQAAKDPDQIKENQDRIRWVYAHPALSPHEIFVELRDSCLKEKDAEQHRHWISIYQQTGQPFEIGTTESCPAEWERFGTKYCIPSHPTNFATMPSYEGKCPVGWDASMAAKSIGGFDGLCEFHRPIQ